MHHPEFPVISFLSVPLLLSSLPSHIRAGSVCTIALMAWLAVMSIIRGVNALIWADNFVVRLEVWCDITTKILIGFTYAVPASALCILRHLESVSSSRSVFTTKSDKRRRQIFEAVMCFGVPALFMGLHYIVQGHRFDLIEDFGCYPSVYVSVAGLCLVYLPPIAMSLVTFGYASMALHHFLRRRIEFATHLRNAQSFMTPGRYFRLMALAIVEMVWDTGVNAYIIYFNVKLSGLRPWISWDDVHSNFSRVGVFPESFMPPEVITQLIWQWWIVPISCFSFFIFFAFGEESMADYRAAIVWVRRVVLRQYIKKVGSHGIGSVLPTHRSPLPHNVDITLPSSADDASDHEMKGWDDLSLQMPEMMKHNTLSSEPYLTDFTLHHGSKFVKHPTAENVTSFASGDNSASSKRSMSMDSSPSPSLDGPSSRPSSPHIQLPATPAPALERLSGQSSSVVTHHPPTTSCYDSTPTVSRSTSARRSISTDFGITVSEAYFTDGPPASQHHEAGLAGDPFSDSLTSRPDPGQEPPHGGIRMTVEKNIV